MSDPKQITPDALQKLVEVYSLDELSTEQLLASFRNDPLLSDRTPEVKLSIDPRSGEPIIFNPSRAVRPHDYPSGDGNKVECPICAGISTGILDMAALKEGCTFINKNLFPVINPPNNTIDTASPGNNSPQGLHFVQWTSSFHDRDWHNLPDEDCLTVLTRLSILEKILLSAGKDLAEFSLQNKTAQPPQWYISIIKNVGSAVGGSLEHGHQQIVLSNIAPRRMLDNQEFLDQHGQVFSAYLQTTTPMELQIRDYGTAKLLVPEFMRRPYGMILFPIDTSKKYIHELDRDEMKAIAKGWKDAICAIRNLMPAMNKEIAFNVITHNGPGAGLYFEFLPYTQEQGGLEQLGLSICQMEPDQAAQELRDQLIIID